MSDPTAPVTDTPISTPTSDTPEIPWQKRYEDLRPEFDRTNAELAAEKAAWDSEEAALQRFKEKFPHLIVEDEPDVEVEDAYEEPAEAKPDPRVDAHDAWIAQQTYERDVARFVGDRELTEQGREVIDALTLKGGNNAKALEAAVTRWFEIAAPPEEKPRPKVPAVPVNGKPATGGKPFHEMTRGERLAHQVERMQSLESQT